MKKKKKVVYLAHLKSGEIRFFSSENSMAREINLDDVDFNFKYPQKIIVEEL